MASEKVHLVFGNTTIRDATMELTRHPEWDDWRIATIPRWHARLWGFDLATVAYEDAIVVVRLDRTCARLQKERG